MIIRRIGTTIVCFCLAMTGSIVGQQCRTFQAAQLKSIFAMSASPTGRHVLFYASDETAEGELVTGNIFDLKLDGTTSGATQLHAPSATNPPSAVWKRDGSTAYFDTDKGIYQVSLAEGVPKLIWSGHSAGLAIAPNGHLLAFWRVSAGIDTLTLYDLDRQSEVHRWHVSDAFESDKSGWDLAFAPDSRSLYARTYDENNRTPLKRFDLITGKVHIESLDCYAVAEGKGANYYIANSNGARSLHKLGADNHDVVVAKVFDYDSLEYGGNLRWIVSQDFRSNETALLDTTTDTIERIGEQEAVAVLPDGQLLLAKGSVLSIGSAACGPKAEGRSQSVGEGATRLPETQEYVEKAARAAGVSSMNISSTTNGKHGLDSHHYSGSAIDIDEINGARVIDAKSDPSIAAEVSAFQNAANSSGVGIAHENYGPAGLYKNGHRITSATLQSENENHVHLTIPQ